MNNGHRPVAQSKHIEGIFENEDAIRKAETERSKLLSVSGKLLIVNPVTDYDDRPRRTIFATIIENGEDRPAAALNIAFAPDEKVRNVQGPGGPQEHVTYGMKRSYTVTMRDQHVQGVEASGQPACRRLSEYLEKQGVTEFKVVKMPLHEPVSPAVPLFVSKTFAMGQPRPEYPLMATASQDGTPVEVELDSIARSKLFSDSVITMARKLESMVDAEFLAKPKFRQIYEFQKAEILSNIGRRKE
jgi:hypothetical protein